MKQLISTLIVLFCICCAQAQNGANTAEQATGLRADGKIYVVIAVVVTILSGLFLYVILLDRKISKLEK